MINELTHPKDSAAGKVLLWLGILLAAALLGFVTVTAIRHNPLNTDVAANGISKFKFIDECKTLATEPEKLSMSMGGQSMTLNDLVKQSSPLKDGESIQSTVKTESVQLIEAASSVEGGGWSMTAPVNVAIQGKTGIRTLGTLPMQCAYSKKDGKTTANLQVPGQ